MRQLATLPNADEARLFADHLLTLKIETRIDQEPNGWAIWICDEDRLAQARKELDEFTRNPADPRYRHAARAAEVLREQDRREEEEAARQHVNLAEHWDRPLWLQRPLTFTLITTSVLVAIFSSLGDTSEASVQSLLIASFRREGAWILWDGLAQIEQGQVWRLVTPIFIHFGFLHLLFNMVMLFDLGGAIEARRGSLRLLVLVLVLAILSNVAQYYYGHITLDGWRPRLERSPLFGGMSGVLYGLFGYIWMKSRFEPDLGLMMHPQTVAFLLAWFFLCMTGLVGPIANVAHAAGLVGGILIGYAPTLWRSLWRGRR
jgi:GlpG protein